MYISIVFQLYIYSLFPSKNWIKNLYQNISNLTLFIFHKFTNYKFKKKKNFTYCIFIFICMDKYRMSIKNIFIWFFFGLDYVRLCRTNAIFNFLGVINTSPELKYFFTNLYTYNLIYNLELKKILSFHISFETKVN